MMSRLTQRIAKLESTTQPEHELVVIQYDVADDGTPSVAQIITHDGAPTPEAEAVRARLTSEGYDVWAGYGRTR